MTRTSMAFLALIGLLAGAKFASAAIGPTGTLTISNAEVSPDGVTRKAVVAGGLHPGPLIKGNKGDRFRINIVNQLTEWDMYRGTSVHWHGLHMNKQNFDDGAAWVTQCPISPNNSFAYDFTAPGQAGTFWYHSHMSTQYCDGLRGPLVIYDPRDPHKHLYDVDDENTIITLSDWFHSASRTAMPHGSLPPIPNSTLINGRGSIVNVRRGKKYRFRIIAMACDPFWDFSIDGHSFSVIEADGENTAPLPVDSFRIFAGQRYSVVLNANQPVANYWIRANPYERRGNEGFDGGRNMAILRYAGAPNADPVSTETPSVQPLREENLHPLTNPAAPGQPIQGGADVNLNFHQEFDFNAFVFKMNGVSFTPPSVPVLLQILSGAQQAQDLLPTGSVYSLPPNKVIELSIPGTIAGQGGPHPFHLHGHTFSVIRSANSTVYNYTHPVRRDTVSTGHIDFHLEMGLAVIFAEDINGTATTNPRPDAWNSLCPNYERLQPDAA
ncbi:laccase [Ephemerocybe angulata]|uniref:Laccase n=1 Tax=Ephemerocybe angulata TaxID=980116 RepID=A0A8H6ME96_9AGAR|nr:laccase [Tulosesus angulatus]